MLVRSTGFTLPELMISLVCSSGLMLSAAVLQLEFLRQQHHILHRVQGRQSAEHLLDVLEQDLRRSGYQAGLQPRSNPLPVHIENQCLLILIDWDDDGQIDGSEEVRGYRFNPARQLIEVKSWLSHPVSAALHCAEDGWQTITDANLIIKNMVASYASDTALLRLTLVANTRDSHAEDAQIERQIWLRNVHP